MGTGQAIENQMYNMVEYVVDEKIKAAAYDKTIRATILSCDDESIAKYKIRYQDAIFFAYGSTSTIRFSPGTEVYVLIPGNDMSGTKTILGSVEKLGTDYVSIINNDVLYIPIGSNAVENRNKIFDLSSYKTEEIIIYKIGEDENQLRINNDILKKSLVDTSYIRLGARFSINIPQEQQGGTGKYGIKFKIKYLKNDGSLERGDHDENCISHSYIIDINDISNNPYTLTDFLQNKEFDEIDGKNFLEIEEISIFSKDFAYQKEIITSDDLDIHIGDLQIIAIKKIDEATSGGAWMVITAPEGPYFDESHQEDSSKKLETTIYVDGKIVNSQSQKVEYYWFVEDVRVNSDWEDKDFYKQHYCSYGEEGWRCLNNYNIIKGEKETDPEIIEWVSGDNFLTIRKKDILCQELRYKCVAVYNNLKLNYEILIHNYDSPYEVNITSSAGELFYFSSGETDLECTLNEIPILEDNDYIQYVWGLIDYKKKEHYFVDGGYTLTTGEIHGNRIEKLPAAEIIQSTSFVYKCSVFHYRTNPPQGEDNYKLLGIGFITITNSSEKSGQHTIIIRNGSQIFKYNENGVAPNENPDGTPFIPEPLSFILYDSMGKEIDIKFLNNDYYWFLPIENTLLDFSNYPDAEEVEIDEQKFIKVKGQPTISYYIAKQYNYNYINNIIRLEIHYQGAIFLANTDFSFIKEGEDGTNGTDYYCRIVPNLEIYNGYSLLAVAKNNGSLEFYSNGEKIEDLSLYDAEKGNFLKAELWENGENITQLVEEDHISWDYLKNSYCKENNKNITDMSYIQYDDGQWKRVSRDNTWWYILGDGIESIPWTPDSPNLITNSPALNIKTNINYNNLNYSATYPLNWLTLNPEYNDYIFNIKGGFRYVTYAADGAKPQYNTTPFEIKIEKEIDEEEKTRIDLTDNCDYNWTAYGYLYKLTENNNSKNYQWEKQDNIFKIIYFKDDEGHTIDKYKIKVSPPSLYDGYCVNYIVQCIIKDLENNKVIAVLQIPVHMMLNKYGHAALNDWDGNSISIDANGNGAILAPQIGAGIKTANNGFTGVLMRKSARSKSYE